MTKPLKLHNSGLNSFRRCRRRWDLNTRQGWRAQQESDKLWIGTAFHRGMRAFHLTNPPDPKRIVPAIDEYLSARIKEWGETPDELPEARSLIIGMFQHYVRYFLKHRDSLETLFVDGEAMCEVPFQIEIGGHLYEGDFDRVILENNTIWVVEYKTAAGFNTEKLTKDHQSTTYIWAANKVFGHLYDVGGMVYQQHRKAVPKEPEPLKRGGLTQNKQKLANVPAYVYERAIRRNRLNIDDYLETLAHLQLADSDESDQFVRRDRVIRTPEELQTYEEYVLAQIPEYYNPRLPIYPNPTNDCAWDCDYAVVCDVMNNKGDHEAVLKALFTKEKQR